MFLKIGNGLHNKKQTPRNLTPIKNGNVQYTREQMDGIASWYGPNFNGKKTANGETYDQNQLTAAHKILPLGTMVKITNLNNNKQVIVRINDRGPYVGNRIIDCSKKVAIKLGFLERGTTSVKLDIVKYPSNYDFKKGILLINKLQCK